MSRPLAGKRIVVTRPRTQAGGLAERLESLGAEVIVMAAIRIEPLDPAPLRAAFAHLGDYAWAIFTSQNAVQIVFDELLRAGLGAAAFGGVRVVAVGPKTAASLRERGLEVAVTPERYVAEGVLDALRGRDDVRGTRVLYAAAEGARGTLPAGLRQLGATVDMIPVYRSVPANAGAAAVRERLERGEIDLVSFASGSAVQAFVAAVGSAAARRAPAASIGPVTSEAVRREGIRLAAEAKPHTVEGLVAAIRAALG